MAANTQDERQLATPDLVIGWLKHIVEGIGRVASGDERVYLVRGYDTCDDGFAVIPSDAGFAMHSLKSVFGNQYPEVFADIAMPDETSMITQQRPAQ